MKTYRALGCFLWTIIVTMMVVIFLLGLLGEAHGQVRTATGTRIPGPTWTPTPTPTMTPAPDPCASCPDPASFSCQAWPAACYQCWADCGQPMATPTPTRTPTRTATPIPTATPTPVGPPCVLHTIGPGRVFLVAVWLHQEAGAKRYTYTAESRDVPAGPYRCDPAAEGLPVGYEWWDANSGELLKSCGDTGRAYPVTPSPTPIPAPDVVFVDGFETGTTEKWNGG